MEQQDTDCEAWYRLLELIDATARSETHVFEPGFSLGRDLWAQIITLPPSISKLKSITRLKLYGSNLVRIPPEIGKLTSLIELDVYTSRRLHWLPFEITLCTRLKVSRASTRALYGNYKFRHPFPRLYDRFEFLPEMTPDECSVCQVPLDQMVLRRWITLRVGSDMMPLLVNACSQACLDSLPTPPENYVDRPHQGGVELQQPPAMYVR